jgi:hypothetical protein
MPIKSQTSVTQTDELTVLRSGFKTPSSQAKARTWWHWINGNISKAGITADLEAMKRVGIQEAQIFNVDLKYPKEANSNSKCKFTKAFR